MSAKLVKYSYGIACCRRRPCGGIEMLMVQKKTTYEFNAFVHANYDRTDTKYVLSLFNKMSTDEKNILLTLDFSMIWYRLFGEGMVTCERNGVERLKPIRRASIYNRKKGLFMTHFAADGGIKLRAMLNLTTCHEPTWEPPKGHRKEGETPIDAAKREFMEETSASIDDFIVLPALGSYKQSFMDAGVTYATEHFFAIAKNDFNPAIRFGSVASSEVSQLRWMTAPDIRALNLPIEMRNRLLVQYEKMTKIFRKKMKPRIIDELYAVELL